MSDTIPHEIIEVIQKLRADAQYDVVQARGREEAYAHILEMLEARTRRRPGRPRKAADVVELPTLDEARGILQPEPENAA